MKVGILTSSRADYSIFRPLLQAMRRDPFFDLGIIAFGTHTSEKFGSTIYEIEQDGFPIIARMDTSPKEDSPAAIASSMAKTMQEFTEFWKSTAFDLVFCLGDRYEVFAACAASVPFGVKLAHLHGGETTLGAIDNKFRHGISHMSFLHFTCTEQYQQRVMELVDDKKNVFNTGALSFDNLRSLNLLSQKELLAKYQIDFSLPSLLITFHPETVDYERNKEYINELVNALAQLKNYQCIITMPNADTQNRVIREAWLDFSAANKDRVRLIENLGTIPYLSAMKHCFCLLGNSSSGFAEAAYFPKWVINVGDRQKGRINTSNILSIPIKAQAIVETVERIRLNNSPAPLDSIYGDGYAAEKIIAILKKF